MIDPRTVQFADLHDQNNWNLLTNNDVISLGDVVVDVGACQGTYLYMFLGILGATGKIHAIEMMPHNYKSIEFRFGHFPNVQFHNVAISDKNGIEPMYLAEGQNEMCGILEHNGTKIGQINSVTLDELLKDEDDISLIKIDVEGAELKVINGMKDVMKRTKSLMIECHDDEIWPEIRRILIEENGFSCYNIEKREIITETSDRAYQCFCRREG